MAEDTPQKPKRLWKIIFAISLALNVAVLGLVAGIGLRSAGGKPPQSYEFGLGPIGQAMTKEQRRNVGRTLRSNADLHEFGRTRGKRMVSGIVDALRAETFDADALRSAMTGADERIAILQSAARDAFVTQVEAMPMDERAALADRLEEVSRHRGGPRQP